jgi:hypothetical protein
VADPHNINKREWELLGRVFAGEIDGFVLQSKARGFKALAELGLIELTKVAFPDDRFGPIVVEGWALTMKGHFMYCEACQWYGPKDEELMERDL